MKNTILLLSALTCFFISCKKDEKTIDCTTIASPSSTTQTMVGAGDTLRLTANIAGDPSSYLWTGPNGFVSTEKIGAVPSVQSNGAGRYTLVVNYGTGCTKTVLTEPVVIQIPDPSCTTTPGLISFSDSASATVTTVTSASQTGLFTLSAQYGGGKIVLQFPSRPVPGVYNIQPSGQAGGQFSFGNARLRLETQTGIWTASSGKIIITENANKLKAVFCGIVVAPPTQDLQIKLTSDFSE